MKGKSESEVTQSCPTLHNPMVFSLPGSSVHGIFQARVLEWVAIAFSEWVAGQVQISAFVLLLEHNLLYASWWLLKAIIFKMDKSYQEVSKSIKVQGESMVQFYTSF